MSGDARLPHDTTRAELPSFALFCGYCLLYGITFWAAPPGLSLLALPVAMALVWLSTVDGQTLTIPDTTIAIIALCALVQFWDAPATLGWSLLEASLCFGVFAAFAALFERRLGQVALGFGDVKLLAASCLLIGVGNIVIAVFLAATGGLALIAVLVALGRHRLQDPIPFGPFLAFAIWLCWLYDLWSFYLASVL